MNPNSYLSPNPQMETLIDDPLWDWSDLLDFTNDQPEPPLLDPELDLLDPEPGRVRKRDPRMTCENFLAGRVPCACPEMDEMMEEEKSLLPEKKRRVKVKGEMKCQVPECGVGIEELKGYHKRHRVCLGCANAKEVVIDGVGKRYCQQCGKFHILSDFDEGKRSCRRKLERHNNRRRRKSNDPSVSGEKELEGLVLSDDLACEDENGKSSCYLSSQIAEKPLLDCEEGKISFPCSSTSPQNVLNGSVVTFTASDETQTDIENEEPKSSRSTEYCDKKSGYSSVCTTGRISFKLYDWNPAEFPRRLRHQIFQWLASMPVELEGYIRPGCTILTAFIAMPNFMWLKLLQEPAVYISDFVAGPEKIFSGRDNFLVYMDDMIFRVLRDRSSVTSIKVDEQAPRLHYVHPTCFEAGKPLEFVACGSNLLQPNFRFLVSFAGKYLAYDYSIASQHNDFERVTAFDNQLLKINIPRTDPDLFGPAFIEVENQYGLSNFIPILIGNQEICSEMKIMEQIFEESPCLKGQKIRENSSLSDSCEVSRRRTSFSQFLLDTAWIIRRPALEDIKHTSASFRLARFNRLLDILIKYQSTPVLVRVLGYIETFLDNMKLNPLADDLASTDMGLLERNMTHAKQILFRKEEDISSFQSRNLVLDANCFCKTADSPSITSSTCQDLETKEERKSDADSKFENGSDNIPLLKKEVVMNMTLMKEPPTRSLNLAFSRKYLISRPHVLAIASVAVCFCVCVVFVHPQEVGRIATTIRRSLFDSTSQP